MNKLNKGNQVIIYSKASHKALRVKDNQDLDGNGDDKDSSSKYGTCT